MADPSQLPDWLLEQAWAQYRAQMDRYDWRSQARPEQLLPQEYYPIILIQGGRGLGKTRAGSEAVREKWKQGCMRIGIVAPTAHDLRETIIDGESGILAVHPPMERPTYYASKRRLEWPNGAIGTLFSGEEPDRLRGPQHEFLLMDEFAAYRYPEEVFDNAMLGLRLGQYPQALITTTPRPLPVLRRLHKRDNVKVQTGSTYENLDNLAPTFREQILEEYAGTRLERQEIMGELIEEVEGALWSYQQIDQQRISESPADLDRIVVGVDPPGSAGTECGIVAVGKRGTESYVLQDASMKGSPEQWARRAVQVYAKWGAHRIVAERNFGGDMVESTIRGVSRDVPVKLTTASRGKTRRAEPVAALYEQGRVFHVGRLPHLEDEMTTYIGDPKQKSPNRMDALVWAMTDLVVRRGGHRGVVWGRR